LTVLCGEVRVQQAPEKKHLKKVGKAETSPDKSAVLSLAAARLKRARRKRAEQPVPLELAGLDLRAVDMDRMTVAAREHFWFNLNRYARRLYGAASDLSALEYAQPEAPVTADHVREAELTRMRRVRRVQRADLGLGFVLDALQILGAALCGALATKPDLVGDAGMLPLCVALVATVTIFLAREVVSMRSAG
jgi:hypothetical protein